MIMIGRGVDFKRERVEMPPLEIEAGKSGECSVSMSFHDKPAEKIIGCYYDHVKNTLEIVTKRITKSSVIFLSSSLNCVADRSIVAVG